MSESTLPSPAPPPPSIPPMTVNPKLTKPKEVTKLEDPKSKVNQPSSDREALLQSIQKGKKLRKTQVNDRSDPNISGKSSSNSNQNSTLNLHGNGTMELTKVPTAGLFAEGFPKLKSTSLKDKDGKGNLMLDDPFDFL